MRVHLRVCTFACVYVLGERDLLQEIGSQDLEAGMSPDLRGELANRRPRQPDGLVPVWVGRPQTIGVTVQFQSKGRQDPGELRFQFESKDRKRLIPQFENSQAGRVFSLTQKRVSLFILFGNQLIGQGPPTAQGSNLLDLND